MSAIQQSEESELTAAPQITTKTESKDADKEDPRSATNQKSKATLFLRI